MILFNYGAKGGRDVNTNYRCHKSNIIPDSMVSVNMTLVYLYPFICLMVVLCALFIQTDRVASFITIKLGQGQTLSYNGLRQIELITLK